MTSSTFDDIRTSMPKAVPFVATLGLEYLELSTDRALLRMPDRADLHNHVAGPHAGAMFSLAESASGAVVLAAFADLMDRVTPLAAGAEITYLKLAMGDVWAEATLGADADVVRAELEGGGLPKFPVHIEIRDGAGVVTGRMTVSWALKPHRVRA